MKHVPSSAIVVGLAVALLAVIGSRVAATGPASAAPARPQPTVMWIELDGRARPFQNGERLALGDVNVEIFVAPYPPLREGTIDLYLTDRATSKPLETNALRVIFDMDMPHGSIRAEALATGGGHFLVPYKLVMPGQWRVEITVTRGGNWATFALIFKVD